MLIKITINRNDKKGPNFSNGIIKEREHRELTLINKTNKQHTVINI